MTPLDDEGEPAQLVASDDDATRVAQPPDEATRAIPRPDEATRRMGRQAVSSSPMTERIAVPERGRSLASGLIATIVVVALTVGGVVGYQKHRPSDDDVIARALVGPGGGVVTFDHVGKLTVPTGALPSPTAITIRRDTIDQRVRLGAEGGPGTVTYEPGEIVVYAFEPADLRFQQPVTIELPRTGNGSAVFVDARGAPRVIPATPAGNAVRISTTSFSFDETTP